ncbi:hypothetical protein GEMRC1_000359 [Eukaryota sp. GEM-RC1]
MALNANPPPEFSSPASRKEAWIWNYFTRLEDKRARCNAEGCEKHKEPYAATTGNSTIVRHLQNHHNDILQPNERKESLQNVQVLTTFLQKRKQDAECDPTVLQNVFAFVLQLIVEQDLPFSFVESPALRNLLLYCVPNIPSLPSRQTVQRRIVAAHNLMETRLKTFLQNLDAHVSLTIDLWTSPAQKSFMGITLHFVDSDFEIKSLVLMMRMMPNPHTGVTIKNFVLAAITEFGLETKLKGITFDNGRNVVSAMNKLKEHFEQNLRSKIVLRRCCAHIINVVVKTLNNKQPNDTVPLEEVELSDIDVPVASMDVNISNTITRVRGFVSKLHQSNVVNEDYRTAFEQQIGSKVVGIPQDVATRWNSTYLMISKYLKYLAVVDVAIDTSRHPKFRKLKLTQIERDALTEVVRFLKPFYQVTTKLSGFKYMYCSDGIALFYMSKLKDHLVNHLQSDRAPHWIRTAADLMLTKLTTYWEFIADEDMVVSGLLDPRIRKEELPDTPAIRQHVENFESNLEDEELFIPSDDESSEDEDIFTEPARKCSRREKIRKGRIYAVLC